MFTTNEKIVGALALGALAFVGVSLFASKARADDGPPPTPHVPIPDPPPPNPNYIHIAPGIYRVSGTNTLPLRMHPEPQANSGIDWVTTPGLTFGVLVEADGQTQNGYAHITRVIGATAARDGLGKTGWVEYRFLVPSTSTSV